MFMIGYLVVFCNSSNRPNYTHSNVQSYFYKITKQITKLRTYKKSNIYISQAGCEDFNYQIPKYSVLSYNTISTLQYIHITNILRTVMISKIENNNLSYLITKIITTAKIMNMSKTTSILLQLT